MVTGGWKLRGRSIPVSPIELPQSLTFDLTSLVQDATGIENSGAMFDDLENGLLAPLTQKPERSSSKRPWTPPSPPSQPAPSVSHRNKKRALKRKKNVFEKGHTATSRTIFEHAQLADPIESSIKLQAFPVAKGGYSTRRLITDQLNSGKEYNIAELTDFGITTLAWDGRDPRPIVDPNGNIFAVLAGMPLDPTYSASTLAAFKKFKAAGEGELFRDGERTHRRGRFSALPFGVSYGNGQKAPARLGTGGHDELVEILRGSKDLERIASFADAAFQLWSPKMYAYYQERTRMLQERTGETRNFPGSIFACASMNFGPRVRSFIHRDFLNLAFGWCAITALGDFDPAKGGHLILWDLKLAVEFPPGSTILIPSAALTHSNTTICRDKSRLSFTQYSAGGLFRWVDNGFQTEEQLKVSDEEGYAQMLKLKGVRWKMGLEMYSKIDDILECM